MTDTTRITVLPPTEQAADPGKPTDDVSGHGTEETAETLARLPHGYRDRLGTRKGTRSLGVFKQAVLVLRWFIDGARLSQLARDDGVSIPTAYRYLHEGLTVLADHAPDLSTALERAAAAGYTHLNLGGTAIRTDRVAAPGPHKADLWWSGKHQHHGGNVQVISAPAGWPIWVSPVRPGREHDTTCARHHGLIDGLDPLATTLGIPTLTDLGYENAGPGFRHPAQKPQGRELTTKQQTFTRSSVASTASHHLNEDHKPSRAVTEKGSLLLLLSL